MPQAFHGQGEVEEGKRHPQCCRGGGARRLLEWGAPIRLVQCLTVIEAVPPSKRPSRRRRWHCRGEVGPLPQQLGGHHIQRLRIRLAQATSRAGLRPRAPGLLLPITSCRARLERPALPFLSRRQWASQEQPRRTRQERRTWSRHRRRRVETKPLQVTTLLVLTKLQVSTVETKVAVQPLLEGQIQPIQ